MEKMPFINDLFYEPFFKDEEGFKADLWLGAFFVGIEPLSFFQKIKRIGTPQCLSQSI